MQLTLATMSAAPPVRIAGGVRRIEIGGTPHGFVFRIDGERTSGLYALGGARGALVPQGGRKLAGAPLAVLTAAGALPAPPATVSGGCPVTARDIKDAGGGRSVVVSLRGHPPRTLGATLGAGLAGLPLP